MLIISQYKNICAIINNILNIILYLHCRDKTKHHINTFKNICVMKTVSIKAILSVIALATMMTLANAASNKRIFNNDTIEEGKVTVREVCSEENGLLSLISRSEMEYNEDGRISVKRDYVWNKESAAWVFVRSVSYSYGDHSYTITLTDAKGNTKVLQQQGE